MISTALRLAHRNGHRDLKEFLSVHRLQFNAASFSCDVAKLAELAAFTADQLAEWTPLPEGRSKKNFRSEIIPSAALVFPNFRRYCPHCLDEDLTAANGQEPDGSAAYLRGWWRMNLIYACPVHRCAMKNNCPGCGLRVPTGSLPLYRCACGFDLRKAATVQLSGDELEGNAYLLGRLGLGERIPSATLDPIPVYQVANVMRRLGAAAVLGKRDTVHVKVGQPDRELAYDQDPAALARLMGAGFQYARDGKASLIRLVDVMAKGEQKLALGPAALFGNKFRSWAIHEDNPIRDQMREVWASKVSQLNYGGKRMAALVGARIPHLQMRPQLLHPLEHRRFEIELGAQYSADISRRQTLKFGKAANILLNRAETAEFLGLTGATLAVVVAFGLLNPAWYSDASSMPAFYRREAADLKSRLLSSHPRHGSGASVSARHVARSRGSGVLAVLLNRALQGEVGIVTCPESDRVTSAVIVLNPDQSVADQCVLTARDVACFAGVSEDDVLRLAASGFLECSDNNASHFREASVLRFLERYISPARLAGLCSSRMDPHKLAGWLTSRGLCSVAPSSCLGLFDRHGAIAKFYEHWSWEFEHEFART
ncbi:MAG: TniQ family protein [Betaproteobacteria bacterium]|nr:TniQ family protein [Betaproteobacteria bacterium]